MANKQVVVRRKGKPHNPGPDNRTPPKPLIPLHPTPALICDKDRTVYHAAWWHQYAGPQLPSQGPLPWQHKNKLDWNLEFWQAARLDQTLLEVFICLAAVKRATIEDSSDVRPYYHHKGKAIALVSEDVNSRSRLTIPTP